MPDSLDLDLGLQWTNAKQLSDDERRTLLQQVRSGEVTELTIEILAFRAVYPNSNYLRFHDHELPAFAASFANQPFLRNHNVHDISDRDGTITGGKLVGDEFHQTVKLTTQRGMIDFLQGTIDRFSIGWYFDDIECSICQTRWMECNHWPGRRYKGPGKNDPEQLCELIFIHPTGKETSAVNAPAVRGTRVLQDDHEYLVPEQLAAILQAKQQYHKGAPQTELAHTPPPPIAPDTTTPPDLNPASLATTPTPPTEEPAMEHDATQETPVPGADQPAQPPAPAASTAEKPMSRQEMADTLNAFLSALTGTGRYADPTPAPTPTPTPAPEPEPAKATTVKTEPWQAAIRESGINAMLQTSGLPAAAQNAVRLAIRPDDTPEQIAVLIDAQRKAIAEQAATTIVRDVNPPLSPTLNQRLGGMLTARDKYKEALFALLDQRRPQHGIKPLAGIKEAYVYATGDWEMTTRYTPDQAILANVTSSALPDMMAEWMNQKVVGIWQDHDRWYEQFCEIQEFASLRDPHWIKIAGIGELSTVAEGGGYSEKEWAAESETSSWTKKGNWIGVTIEAIDRDTTGYIQQLPRALAQAAWLTINKDFTRRLKAVNGAGYGYTMASDSTPLFHANHNNLGNSALSYSAWEAVRLAMARQTELGTGEVLGGLTLPVTIMVPRHLENTAITVLATERVQGSGNNDINPLAAEGESITQRRANARKMLVVNDYLGLDNDWYAFADPRRFPLFGLGFRWGRAPEIFSVADPTSGLMFTNDVLPIKIRWYYSLGAIDHRGMYMEKVA